MMRRKLFCLVAVIFLVGVIYSFSGKEKALVIRLWRDLDRDIIYLNNGDAIRGWLLEQKDDLIVISTEDNETLIYNPSECQSIQENILLTHFEKLI